MTIRYSITIETNQNSGVRQLTLYSCDDGNFVSNVPTSFDEKNIVSKCKELSLLAGSKKLEIKIVSS